MSARRLIFVPVILGLVIGMNAAAASPGIDVQGTDIQHHEDSVEGVLIVGSRGEPLHKLPKAPAKAGSGHSWTCGFYLLLSDVTEGFTPGEPMTNLEKATPQDGGYYWFICTDETGARVLEELRMYTAANPAALVGLDEAPAIDLQRLAVRIDALKPTIMTSPPQERSQMVNVKTWFWIPGWDRLSDIAANDAGFNISLSATPVELIIDPGDGQGHEIQCTRDTAIAWTPEGPSDTDCGYRYFRRSTTEPDGAFHVKARLRYADSTWSVAGPGVAPGAGTPAGDITSANADVRLVVQDAQAVIR
jgi:hypothetical protein